VIRRIASLGRWHDPPRHSRHIGDEDNLVETAIRPTKLGAKNWLFIGCREARQKAADLYSIENGRRLGIDSREYLEDVLSRLQAMNASEAASLTSASWLRAPRRRRHRDPCQ